MANHRRARVLTGGGTGALDKIDGAGLSAGDVCQVVNSTGIYHYVNIQDSAAENSPYVIRPDSNAGTNSWHLVTPQGPMSHVSATTAAAQSIPNNTATTIIFGTEEQDDLGEYNNTTGIFTATYSGYYQVSAFVRLTAATWATAKYCMIDIIKNSTIYRKGLRIPTWGTQTLPMQANICSTVKLAASDTLKIDITQTQGAAVTLQNSATYNYLTIDRLI